MEAEGKIRKAGDRQPASTSSVLRLVATASYIPLLDRYPILGRIKLDQWDVVFTVAAVHAVLFLRAKTEADYHRFTQGLESIHPHAFDALEDCSKFVARTLSAVERDASAPKVMAALGFALGSWIIWNSFGRQPSEEENDFSSAIGNLVICAAREI
jgi:hypothetical protein